MLSITFLIWETGDPPTHHSASEGQAKLRRTQREAGDKLYDFKMAYKIFYWPSPLAHSLHAYFISPHEEQQAQQDIQADIQSKIYPIARLQKQVIVSGKC